MKEYMQILGCEIIDNDFMELTLVPLSIAKKKKVGLMDLAGGDMDSLLAMLPQKQNKTKLFVRIEQWGNMRLMIGRHVSVELLPDDTTGGIK
jgi:hypothetical protein